MKRGIFSLWFGRTKTHLCTFHTTLIEGEIKYFNESFENISFCIVYEHEEYVYGYRNIHIILSWKLYREVFEVSTNCTYNNYL